MLCMLLTDHSKLDKNIIFLSIHDHIFSVYSIAAREEYTLLTSMGGAPHYLYTGWKRG